MIEGRVCNVFFIFEVVMVLERGCNKMGGSGGLGILVLIKSFRFFWRREKGFLV